jgi:mannan polymerase II complex MNN10 subunit
MPSRSSGLLLASSDPAMIPPRRKQDFVRILLIVVFLVQAAVFFRHEFQGKDKDHVVSSAYNPNTVSSEPSHRKSKATGAKFAVGSMNDRETSYDIIAISNKIKYTQKRGYDMIWSFDGAEGNWGKDWDRLKMMERAIKGKLAGENAYEWIWWIDYDLIVTNSSITLESMVELALAPYSAAQRDQIDMIITPDCFPVNSGSMLVRTTPYMLELFKTWWQEKEIPNDEGDPRSLQDCLRVSRECS